MSIQDEKRRAEIQASISNGGVNADLLAACMAAYRKHVQDDESIGWEELGAILSDSLCNALGDDGFITWLYQKGI